MAPSVFLTAYDPTDLPAGSIDPLGFNIGYLALAEEFLPGLTGVASQPKYLPALCAGVLLADTLLPGNTRALPPARRRQARAEVAMRLERAWALASGLADKTDADSNADAPGSPGLAGLRGVTYVEREVERVVRESRRRTGTRFPLLARQYTYGMMGIYGSIAYELGLLEKPDFTLTPSLGAPIAAAFLDRTLPDGSDRHAIGKLATADDATVSIDLLTAWGGRAGPWRTFSRQEADLLRDGLLARSRRAYSLRLIERVAPPGDAADEEAVLDLSHAAAEEAVHQNGEGNLDALRVAAALNAIRAYERAYRMLMLGFYRLLWLCRQGGDTCACADVHADPVIEHMRQELGPASLALDEACIRLRESGLSDAADAVHDAVRLVREAGRAPTTAALTTVIMKRHDDVQRGKFDRGRRKLPWLEMRGATIAITSARVAGADRPLESPDRIALHAWRTYSARAFISAVGGVS